MKFKQPALLLFIAGVVHCANAHAYTFDASMLGDAAKGVDMSLFNQGVQQPGTYRVDVMVKVNVSTPVMWCSNWKRMGKERLFWLLV